MDLQPVQDWMDKGLQGWASLLLLLSHPDCKIPKKLHQVHFHVERLDDQVGQLARKILRGIEIRHSERSCKVLDHHGVHLGETSRQTFFRALLNVTRQPPVALGKIDDGLRLNKMCRNAVPTTRGFHNLGKEHHERSLDHWQMT